MINPPNTGKFEDSESSGNKGSTSNKSKSSKKAEKYKDDGIKAFAQDKELSLDFSNDDKHKDPFDLEIDNNNFESSKKKKKALEKSKKEVEKELDGMSLGNSENDPELPPPVF